LAPLLEYPLFFTGFFADGGSAAQAEFLKAASALRESYRFAHTNSEELLQQQGVEAEYVVLLLQFILDLVFSC
jgi:hypothetical protein